MISVLISNYNRNISGLLIGLGHEKTGLNCQVEIIVLEDHPSSQFNDSNHQTSLRLGIKHVINEKNLGRSRNRNKLATFANYSFLVFLDGDASYKENFPFLANYINSIEDTLTIHVGGTLYRPNPPTQKEFLLHWYYGHNRESNATYPEKTFKMFSSFNFMISKELFYQIRFDEDIVGYGYEDTFFAFRLFKQGAHFEFINNQMYHDGLNEKDIFFHNQLNAAKNLATLHYRNLDFNQVRLIKVYYKIIEFPLVKSILFWTSSISPSMAFLVRPTKIGLFFLDLIKLSIFHKTLKSLRDHS